MNIPQAGSRQDLASVMGELVSQSCDGRTLQRRGRGIRGKGGGGRGGGAGRGRGRGAARSPFHLHFLAPQSLLLVFLCVLLLAPEAAAQAEPTSGSPTTTTATGLTVETGRAEDSVPTLFDTNAISSNSSTTTCPAFFAKFLADKSFLACLPLSGLLLNSLSYFEISKQGSFATTRVVDKTCSVNLTACSAVMEKLGWQIRLEEHCGTEYRYQNPIVQQAYAAFIAYRIEYSAGCLKSDSGSYCYVDAIMNSSSSGDSYVYYLPLGVKFPNGSRPTCSTCLSRTMAIFAAEAGNQTQPLSTTFLSAAEQINIGCGAGFVNSTVVPVGAAASVGPPPWSWETIVAAVMMAVMMLL